MTYLRWQGRRWPRSPNASKGMDAKELAAGQIPSALKTLFELELKALGYEDRVELTGKDGGPVKVDTKTQHVFQPSQELWDEVLRIAGRATRGYEMATQTKKPPLTVSNPWWGHEPSDKQLKALWVYEECPNLFYGGAAGPGKTSYLLMACGPVRPISSLPGADTPQDLR